VSVPGWLTAAPETTADVRIWFMAIFAVYLAARKGFARLHGGVAPTDMARLSDTNRRCG